MTEAMGRSQVSADVRQLLGLIDLRPRPDRDQLRPYLEHPHPVVRQTAVDVVAELRPEWGFDALCLAMLDASDRVCVAAAEGLRGMEALLPDEPQLFDFLEQALGSTSPSVREVAVRLLRRTSDAGTATFVGAARDPEPRVRAQAVRALVGFRAVREICKLGCDPDADVRVEVATALVRLADPRAHEVLRRLAADEDPTVRAAAAR